MQPQVTLQEMQRGVDVAHAGPPRLEGIFSKAWMHKHQHLIPSCVVLVCRAETRDAEVGRVVAELRRGLKQHAQLVRIVVVLFAESDVPSALEVPHKVEQIQQRTAALARELKLAGPCVTVINSADAAEGPLAALARVVRNESSHYYESKIVRADQHILRLKQQQQHHNRDRAVEAFHGATIRYNLKIARLYEAKFIFDKALKHYESAYLACLELASRKGSIRPSQQMTEELLVHENATYPVMEIKTVAEILHLRLCRLRLASSQSTKAILAQFDRHMKAFRNLEGPASLIFQHWAWLAAQHLSLARLIRELGTAVSLSDLSSLDRARCQIGYHIRLAARFAIRRREAAQALGIAGPAAPSAQQLREQRDALLRQNDARIEASPYVGAYPMVVGGRGATPEASVAHSLIQCAVYLDEAKVDQGARALNLLRKVLELSTETNKDARSVRLIAGTRARIGRELVQRGDVGQAMPYLLHAANVFNREQWFDLAQPVLADIFASAVQLDPGNDAFDISKVSERRKVMHSALCLLAMRAVPAQRKAEIARQFLVWLARPVRRAEDASAPDGARLKLGFTLDDLDDAPMQWFAWFDRREAAVGETVQLHVRIRSTFHIETRFETLTVIFNDSRYEASLTQGQDVVFAANEERTFQIALQLLDLDPTKLPVGPAADGAGNTADMHGAAAASALRGMPLTPVRLQLKLVAPEDRPGDPPAGFAMLSGVSLWSSAREVQNAPLHSSDTVLNLISAVPGPHGGQARPTAPSKASPSKQGLDVGAAHLRPSRSLVIRPFQSSVRIGLKHAGFALVREMFELEAQIEVGREAIRDGKLLVSCDPPLQSKSTPFFFTEDGKPLPLSNEDLQPSDPLKEGLSLEPGASCTVKFACHFNSLPYSASAADGRKQARTCIAVLDYMLPHAGIRVRACETFEIPCCLPFQSQVKLTPRNPQLPSALSVNAPCTVDLDLLCTREPMAIERIEVVDVLVEPSHMCTVTNEWRPPSPSSALASPSGLTSVLPAPVTMHAGERLSLGFEVSTSSAGDNVTLGYIAVRWRREEGRPESDMYVSLPKLRVEHTQFYFTLTTSPARTKRVGETMAAVLDIQNATEIAQELDVSVAQSASFFMAGSYASTLILAPMQSTKLRLDLVPLVSGNLQLPTVTVESKRLKARYKVPSPTEAMVFVAPSAPS